MMSKVRNLIKNFEDRKYLVRLYKNDLGDVEKVRLYVETNSFNKSIKYKNSFFRLIAEGNDIGEVYKCFENVKDYGYFKIRQSLWLYSTEDVQNASKILSDIVGENVYIVSNNDELRAIVFSDSKVLNHRISNFEEVRHFIEESKKFLSETKDN